MSTRQPLDSHSRFPDKPSMTDQIAIIYLYLASMSDNIEADLVEFGKSISKLEEKMADIGNNSKEEKYRKQLEIETGINDLNNIYYNDLLFNVASTSQEQLKDLREKLHRLTTNFRPKACAPRDENNERSKDKSICSLSL